MTVGQAKAKMRRTGMRELHGFREGTKIDEEFSDESRRSGAGAARAGRRARGSALCLRWLRPARRRAAPLQPYGSDGAEPDLHLFLDSRRHGRGRQRRAGDVHADARAAERHGLPGQRLRQCAGDARGAVPGKEDGAVRRRGHGATLGISAMPT